ncbi:MAG: Mur ligase domain-containing protein [Chitinophagaceae bacterium]
MLLSSIASACRAEWSGARNDISVQVIVTDSRAVREPENCLFVAVKTARSNGHDYIASAYQHGVRAFLVSEHPDLSVFPDASFFTGTRYGECIAAACRQRAFRFRYSGYRYYRQQRKDNCKRMAVSAAERSLPHCPQSGKL